LRITSWIREDGLLWSMTGRSGGTAVQGSRGQHQINRLSSNWACCCRMRTRQIRPDLRHWKPTVTHKGSSL